LHEAARRALILVVSCNRKNAPCDLTFTRDVLLASAGWGRHGQNSSEIDVEVSKIVTAKYIRVLHRIR
jgi:hypothetical protein